jgi:hypothetical protein
LKADRFSFGWMVSTLGFGLALKGAGERIAPRSFHRPIPAGRTDETSPLSGEPLSKRLSRYALIAAIVIAYLVATYFIAWADLQVQGLILVAAIYAILAICLDATAGILGLYSLASEASSPLAHI